MAMKHKANRQLRISTIRESSSSHRYHPYRRPLYLDYDKDTAHMPRLDDDNLLDTMRDIEWRGHRPNPLARPLAIGVNDGMAENNAEEDIEGRHDGMVVRGISLLDFLVALFFFVKQILLVGFVVRGGRVDDGE